MANTRFEIAVSGQAVGGKTELLCRPSFQLLDEIPLSHPVGNKQKKGGYLF